MDRKEVRSRWRVDRDRLVVHGIGISWDHGVRAGVDVAIASGLERNSIVRTRSGLAIAQGALQSHEISTELSDISHLVHDGISEGIHSLVG